MINRTYESWSVVAKCTYSSKPVPQERPHIKARAQRRKWFGRSVPHDRRSAPPRRDMSGLTDETWSVWQEMLEMCMESCTVVQSSIEVDVYI